MPGATQDESEPEPEPEPMDWWLVSQNSALNFARDTGGSTLQRAAEKLAQPRVRDTFYREMIKSAPRMARRAPTHRRAPAPPPRTDRAARARQARLPQRTAGPLPLGRSEQRRHRRRAEPRRARRRRRVVVWGRGREGPWPATLQRV